MTECHRISHSGKRELPSSDLSHDDKTVPVSLLSHADGVAIQGEGKQVAGVQLQALPEEKRPVKVTFAVGYRTNDTYLLEDLKKRADVLISTDDGSLGTHGTVIDAIREGQAEADVMFACGPKPMLRAVKEYCGEKGMACYVSMEERMACGVGVCLGCVCRTTDINDHSKVRNARVCKDGPVFDAEEVDLT